jgi:hypothetical protein
MLEMKAASAVDRLARNPYCEIVKFPGPAKTDVKIFRITLQHFPLQLSHNRADPSLCIIESIAS